MRCCKLGRRESGRQLLHEIQDYGSQQEQRRSQGWEEHEHDVNTVSSGKGILSLSFLHLFLKGTNFEKDAGLVGNFLFS